jgi:hypothetical protein
MYNFSKSSIVKQTPPICGLLSSNKKNSFNHRVLEATFRIHFTRFSLSISRSCFPKCPALPITLLAEPLTVTTFSAQFFNDFPSGKSII